MRIRNNRGRWKVFDTVTGWRGHRYITLDTRTASRIPSVLVHPLLTRFRRIDPIRFTELIPFDLRREARTLLAILQVDPEWQAVKTRISNGTHLSEFQLEPLFALLFEILVERSGLPYDVIKTFATIFAGGALASRLQFRGRPDVKVVFDETGQAVFASEIKTDQELRANWTIHAPQVTYSLIEGRTRVCFLAGATEYRVIYTTLRNGNWLVSGGPESLDLLLVGALYIGGSNRIPLV